MISSHPLPAPCQWFAHLASTLDRRSAPRLALLLLGAVLARGRRTVTSWIRAAGLSDEFRPSYTAVAAAGKKAESIAARRLHLKQRLAAAFQLSDNALRSRVQRLRDQLERCVQTCMSSR